MRYFTTSIELPGVLREGFSASRFTEHMEDHMNTVANTKRVDDTPTTTRLVSVVIEYGRLIFFWEES